MDRTLLKKFIVVFSVAGIVALGMLGALAVVPHGHGHDLDHSSHETCPVHQVALHSLLLALFAATVVAFAASFRFLLKRSESLFVLLSFHLSAHPRAPPAA